MHEFNLPPPPNTRTQKKKNTTEHPTCNCPHQKQIQLGKIQPHVPEESELLRGITKLYNYK